LNVKGVHSDDVRIEFDSIHIAISSIGGFSVTTFTVKSSASCSDTINSYPFSRRNRYNAAKPVLLLALKKG